MQTAQNSALGINGTRTTGMDVRKENLTAALAVANAVKSSLGPIGLDKMLVDEVGDVVVTNDGATILKRLDVKHPVGMKLVQIAQLQDHEVGDGTTSVVIVAAELLRRAQELVSQGIHPSNINSGYKLALREAVKYLEQHLSVRVDSLGKDVLMNVARTSMSSKIINTESDLFAKMVVDAILSVKTINDFGDVVYPRRAVSILLLHGRSAKESHLVQGFALYNSRAAQGMPTAVKDAKIALVDFDLRPVKMKLGVNITITDPTKADAIRQREIDITRERIRKIIAAGANVILTSWGIDDTMLKLLVENNIIGVRRVRREDMRRIAKATGATVVHTMSDLAGEEVYESGWLGNAERVTEEKNGDGDEYISITGTKSAVCASIVCRGANYFVLEEMERALNDALWAVARTLEANSVVPGGGAVESALSVYLESFANTLGGREQLAVAQFAEALLVVPKTLALNAALDATDLVARLRVDHTEAISAAPSDGSSSSSSSKTSKHQDANATNGAEKKDSEAAEEKKEGDAAEGEKKDEKAAAAAPAEGEKKEGEATAAAGSGSSNGEAAPATKTNQRFYGLDLNDGTIRDNVANGVLEPRPSKIKSLGLATEGCLGILRVDDCVRLNPEEEAQ